MVQDLIKYVGSPTYLRMLRRDKPRNESQWAYCCLISMQTADRLKKERLKALQESYSIRSRGVLGNEDEQLAEEWAEYAQRLS
ncbi:hypothetical protein UFOVP276_36 [uncultured Caudovirales phage]|uniref:Uncharacterized protein n=1 Tax=uncultured Caudovirales phage TaxID=2100421 RepID=A0A6J5LPM7_9CAUD|nr:hypothetical protein UFOVP127_173 [uncultured Caudovirales phage]CAB4134957.1 hypothetical protein UFOVP276_36 [uncultured Caudovirales phage]